MNVYDTANRLAHEIKTSEEYKGYKEIKEKINSNPEKKKKVDDFEALRYKTQLNTFQAKENTKEDVEKMQEMYKKLLEDEEIKSYFELEFKFNVMLTDVNQIIAGSVEDLLK